MADHDTESPVYDALVDRFNSFFLGLVGSAPEAMRPTLLDDIIDYCKRYRVEQYGVEHYDEQEEEEGVSEQDGDDSGSDVTHESEEDGSYAASHDDGGSVTATIRLRRGRGRNTTPNVAGSARGRRLRRAAGRDEAARFDAGALLKIAAPIDDEDNVTLPYLRRVMSRAYDMLMEATFSRQKQGKKGQEFKLSHEDAIQILKYFFNSGFGTTRNRVYALLDDCETINAGALAYAQAVHPDTPAILKGIYADISVLLEQEHTSIYRSTRYYLSLVHLERDWSNIREALASRNSRDARDIIEFLEIEEDHLASGVSYISLAKRAVCAATHMTEGNFADKLRAAHIPSAIADTFGLGAILFLPVGHKGQIKNAGRGSIPSPAAARQYMSIIAEADNDGIFTQISKAIYERVVYAIMNRGAMAVHTPVRAVEAPRPDAPLMVMLEGIKAAVDSEGMELGGTVSSIRGSSDEDSGEEDPGRDEEDSGEDGSGSGDEDTVMGDGE